MSFQVDNKLMLHLNLRDRCISLNTFLTSTVQNFQAYHSHSSTVKYRQKLISYLNFKGSLYITVYISYKHRSKLQSLLFPEHR